MTTVPQLTPDESISYRELAVKLLIGQPPLCPLTAKEAEALVDKMHPYVVPAGEPFIVEEESRRNNFMMLILAGEVRVESKISDKHSLTIALLGQGQWVGELGVLDGGSRRATCIAAEDNDVVGAIINKKEFQALLKSAPVLAAKLAILLAVNTAYSLRDTHQKMCRYVEIQNVFRNSKQ